MARLLGIDVGTTSTKALLIDEQGEVLHTSHHSYPLLTPQPGWAEQNPEDWWDAVQKCLSGLPFQPDAIGVSGQMHGSVFLDSNDDVVRPALLWCDQRTERECEEIDQKCGAARVRAITCNPPLTGFQLPKVLWLRNNEPANFVRTTSVLLPKDYIVMKLTGVKSTDVSDASGVGALDVGKRRWSPELLAGVSLDSSLFPKVQESSDIVGRTDGGIPVVSGAGDQAGGAVGVGAVSPGIVSLSLGTSGVAFGSLDTLSSDPTGSAHVFCHANLAWHAMGVMLSCGGAIRWARDTFFSSISFDEMTNLAEKAPVGSEGLTFLPYLAGERCPVNDPNARGALVGLSLAHGPEHIARAVFEGATFGLAGCLHSLKALGVQGTKLRLTGGGAASPFWRQMVADVTGHDCVTLKCDEGPAFGAAILAGVGIGLWPSVEDACDHIVKEESVCSPSGSDYSAALVRYNEMYPALKGLGAHENTIK